MENGAMAKGTVKESLRKKKLEKFEEKCMNTTS
jgi:hypothetical protein